MSNISEMDFRGNIVDIGEDYFIVDHPGISYLMSKDSENKPLCADNGGRHLGEMVPGIAVAFPSKRYGLMHKHFGLGFFEGGDGGDAGEPFAYGKGASLSSSPRAKEMLVAAMIGDFIMFGGKRWKIAAAANENIELIPA